MSVSDFPQLEHATAQQGLAAKPNASVWVSANAGSGKTKVLIDRVARLLLERVSPDAILCVTYTKAAASEMQGRLFDRLGSWCVMSDADLRQELTKLQGKSPEDIQLARELFARALETPGGLRIETIHAFCGRLLRRFPLEADVPPGFQELDDDDTGDLWRQSIRAFSTRLVSTRPDLLDALRIVAEAGGVNDRLSLLKDLLSDRSALTDFIARAGSVDDACTELFHVTEAGTQTEDQIIDRAMGADLPRDDLLKAAQAWASGSKKDIQQAELVYAALSDAPADERFDALVHVFTTAKGEMKADTSIATKNTLRDHPIITELFSVGVPEGSEVFRLGKAIAACKARRLYERSASLLRLAIPVFEEFAWRKRLRAGLDFDDLIQAVLSLLTRKAAAEWVLWKLDGGIEHVLLDEAQDTAPAQWKILGALTDDIFQGQGVDRERARTLFVVGDQKQSIYSFQGADPEHFLNEARHFFERAEIGGIVHERPNMEMSFRSCQEILNFVDQTFNIHHFGGAPFSIQPPDSADIMTHTASRRNESGCVEIWPITQHPELKEASPWDAPLDQESESTAKAALAASIAAWIEEQLARRAAVWDGKTKRPCRPGDFLILVKGRTGGLFDGILQALKRKNLPVAGADRLQLLDSLPVQDLLNLIRFVLCPEDDLTVAEILKGPFGGLDDDLDLIPLIARRPEGASVWSRLQASSEARHTAVRTFLSILLANRHAPPFEFLSLALERCNGLGRPGWELILSRFGSPSREPVTALIDRAVAFDRSGPANLEIFLSAIESAGGEVKRELSGPQDEIRIMTVHGAKGLQAPIVILPDTTSAPRMPRDGVFVLDDDSPMPGALLWPGSKDNDTALTQAQRELADAKALREHRRLLYVALTRAQDQLIICGAHGRKNGAARDENSWYALCERGMIHLRDTGRVTDIETETGIRSRYGDPPGIELASGAAPGASLSPPTWLDRPAPKESSPVHIVAPTEYGGKEPPVLAPFGPDREARLRRGRIIHALFEGLPELPASDRERVARAYLDRQKDIVPADREEMFAAVMGVLSDPAFAPLFAPHGRVEAPIVGKIGDDIVNGRVDRLVVNPDEVVIIDYKTDRPAPPDVSGVAFSYKAQMAAYSRVLRDAYPKRRIRCLLVWTDGPRLMELDEKELENMPLIRRS